MVSTGQNMIANKDVDVFNGLPVVGQSPSTPGVAIGSAAGSGATVSVVGGNLAGVITFNSGTGILGSGALFTLTFANSFAFPTNCAISLEPNNSAAAGANGNVYITTTTTSFTVNVILGVNTSTAFKFMYIVVGW